MNLGAYPALAVQEQIAFAAGGRLTLVQNTPVIASDQASKAVIYYTPDRYGAFPIIKNGIVRPVYFNDDLVLTMTSAFTGSGIFDLFGIERGGKGVMVAGVAWATPTAGSGARGTTPGQTELTRVAGMRVNRWGMPGLSAENATYIEPLEGHYFGSVFVDASAGQTTCHVSSGQSRKHGLWNASNRKLIVLKCTDATASWAYGATTLRASRNDATNLNTIFCGLAEETVHTEFKQNVTAGVSSSNAVFLGIGVNSTTVASGFSSNVGNNAGAVGNEGQLLTLPSEYDAAPFIGINNLQALEASNASSATFKGSEVNMLMTSRWLG